jgi:hypothetical protein
VNTSDIPQEWRERISGICFWLADNYAVWQPFALMLAVGLLLCSISLLFVFWENL